MAVPSLPGPVKPVWFLDGRENGQQNYLADGLWQEAGEKVRLSMHPSQSQLLWKHRHR
jgi:hypothetical protein